MGFDQVNSNSNLTFLEHPGRIRGQIGRVLIDLSGQTGFNNYAL